MRRRSPPWSLKSGDRPGAAALDQAPQPGPLQALELGQHGVEHQRRALAEGRHQQAAERLAEAGVGAVPGARQLDAVERLLDLFEARSEGAHAHGQERRRIVAEVDAPHPVAGEEGRPGDLGEVVVLGGDPEHRHRRRRRGLDRRGPVDGCGHLAERQERPAVEPRLLAGDHHPRLGIRQARRQLPGGGMAVGGVRGRQRPRQLAAVDPRRRVRQLAGVEEADRRQQVAVATLEEGGGQGRQPRAGEEIELEEGRLRRACGRR